jgi:hypothetical protein
VIPKTQKKNKWDYLNLKFYCSTKEADDKMKSSPWHRRKYLQSIYLIRLNNQDIQRIHTTE